MAARSLEIERQSAQLVHAGVADEPRIDQPRELNAYVLAGVGIVNRDLAERLEHGDHAVNGALGLVVHVGANRFAQRVE